MGVCGWVWVGVGVGGVGGVSGCGWVWVGVDMWVDVGMYECEYYMCECVSVCMCV